MSQSTIFHLDKLRKQKWKIPHGWVYNPESKNGQELSTVGCHEHSEGKENANIKLKNCRWFMDTQWDI